jgi:oligoribonuclease NrnB/cAMP/cGMP phosphodiesterase (DHH superfamily)
MYYGAQVSEKHLSSEEEALILMEIEEEQRLLSEQSNAVALDEELDYDENMEWL